MIITEKINCSTIGTPRKLYANLESQMLDMNFEHNAAILKII